MRSCCPLRRCPGEADGFALVESLIALGILGFSLLALAGLFASGLARAASTGPDIVAREKASDAVESVFTARDTRTIAWSRIRNVRGASGSDDGVFLDGEVPLRIAGSDGLLGTADDSLAETTVLPGPDNRLGTADDRIVPLTNFTREIVIRDVGANLRQLTIIIRYRAGTEPREYRLETFISAFA